MVPFLLALVYPDAIPGLQTPSAARSEKRKVTERILAAIDSEQASRLTQNV